MVNLSRQEIIANRLSRMEKIQEEIGRIERQLRFCRQRPEKNRSSIAVYEAEMKNLKTELARHEKNQQREK